MVSNQNSLEESPKEKIIIDASTIMLSNNVLKEEVLDKNFFLLNTVLMFADPLGWFKQFPMLTLQDKLFEMLPFESNHRIKKTNAM